MTTIRSKGQIEVPISVPSSTAYAVERDGLDFVVHLTGSADSLVYVILTGTRRDPEDDEATDARRELRRFL